MEDNTNGDGTYRHEVTTLFLQHKELIYRIAFRVTGKPCDAEDVVQKIFLKLLESGDKRDTSTGIHQESARLFA